VEKNQYRLCIEVLRRLEKAGVLQDMVLIGSWCLPFYKDYFSGVAYSPSIRTRDIDFLIPRTSAIKSKINLIEAMRDLGFIRSFRGSEGYIVLDHPELAIEFLVPEKGKGTDKPVQIPQLGLNAQALRFLELLAKDTIQVKLENVSIVLPHPINFALHKLIISQRRGTKDKAQKDLEAAIEILKALIAQKEQDFVEKVFKSLPSKWQKAVLSELEKAKEGQLLKALKK
jgi:hypothetical protein